MQDINKVMGEAIIVTMPLVIYLAANRPSMTLIELYYSDICMNCHYVRNQIIEVLPEGVMFKEINVTSIEGAERAKQLGIEEVPSITINGEVVLIGRVEKGEIQEELEEFL
ncbi:thioredoxin family protein [Methanococcoides sp. AM1]|uniref:thioredoxin family protein n=1 Tax=Methanococcoides sp. AM1 TaxID=1201011 RepID=UPI001083A745|nr:thioredoxin family protein [Methanococcoides sp. AM1]